MTAGVAVEAKPLDRLLPHSLQSLGPGGREECLTPRAGRGVSATSGRLDAIDRGRCALIPCLPELSHAMATVR